MNVRQGICSEPRNEVSAVNPRVLCTAWVNFGTKASLAATKGASRALSIPPTTRKSQACTFSGVMLSPAKTTPCTGFDIDCARGSIGLPERIFFQLHFLNCRSEFRDCQRVDL